MGSPTFKYFKRLFIKALLVYFLFINFRKDLDSKHSTLGAEVKCDRKLRDL